jgi:chromosome segregation ATPase
MRLKELRNQLEPLFPGIRQQHDLVKRQLNTLRAQREEIELADQEELRRVREEISIVNEGIESRQREMEIQARDAQDLSSEEAELRRLLDESKGKIDRAERIKELNRGFEKNEVEGFKGM